MKIAIGNDHAGTTYKFAIMELLAYRNIEAINKGTDNEESVDYPDYIHPVASVVASGEVDFGIILCGSGNGASMVANRYKNVRAALCWNKELSELARKHNDANILSIPARFTSVHQAVDMCKAFLDTSFEGGRHTSRVGKIEK